MPIQIDTPPDVTVELISRIRSGEQNAWTELYQRYHDQLLLAVRCRLGSGLRTHLQSEDILQSVFVEALQEMSQFEMRGAGSLRHFLNVLITNKIRDRADTFKAKKRRGAVPLTDAMLATVPDSIEDLSYRDTDRYEQLERCLDQLPERMRRAIVLRRIEGLSSKELAHEFEMTDAAARKLYSRALAKLAMLVGDQ